jgi:alpha-1,3-glucan synthase
LAKFASVQDRLREWRPDTAERIKVFSCLAIEAFDIDGIRIDKATQVTVDFMSEWAAHTRDCARALGKDRFFIPGEVTGGNTFGSLYIGRGTIPNTRPQNFDDAIAVTANESQYFLRGEDVHGLDSVAFHYSIYRSLCRFLGMDGNLQVAYDVDTNFVTAWNQMVQTNDFLDPYTGAFDPLHQFGTGNHDVFRWPGLANGTQRQQLGQFICNVLLPGMALGWYGEEQEMYILDNGAANYLYGRQPMVSSIAWKRHGCYKLGSTQYYNMPYDKTLTGCDDPWNSLDHFDPTAEARRGIRNQHFARHQYPTLLDGFALYSRNNWTERIQLPGSNTTQTELGMWSIGRAPHKSQEGQGAFESNGTITQMVWILYSNENYTRTWSEDCTGNQNAILAPFEGRTLIRNIFWPYETVTLDQSDVSFFDNGESPYTGCIPSIEMKPFDYKVYVPADRWLPQQATMSGFTPGHDARLTSRDTVDIVIEYDTEMDCDSLQGALSIVASTGGVSATPQFSGGSCAPIPQAEWVEPGITGVAPSRWRYTGQVTGVVDGIYYITVGNFSAYNNPGVYSDATDHLLFRVGSENNPMVFPETADYSNDMFTVSGDTYTLKHQAPGADQFRYSADFGQTWAPWQPYEQTSTLNATLFQDKTLWWKGDHVEVQYWSEYAGSAAHVMHADANWNGGQRRWPQLLARGTFNNWGYDLGASAHFREPNAEHDWVIPMSASWPTYIQLNVWAYDDYFYGDTDGDGIIDRLPPNAQQPNYLNISIPPAPYLAWNVHINELTGAWTVVPIGHQTVSIVAFALLAVIPVLTAFLAATVFRYSFYSIKVNKWGLKPAKEATSYFPIIGGHKGEKDKDLSEKGALALAEKPSKQTKVIGWPEDAGKRRKVLIATLEYEIIDWKLKVKIGGLGVMSTLMGKAMSDVDLIWVVPKVADLEYPQGEYAEPIEVIIFGEPYLIEVETHQLDNITYVILDSPVFRAQTKSDPYPQRMDDLSSAIFYSTWNQAIAETIRRYPIIDIYHINDYHGALAPLYLLPRIMPVCLSLHNAEFQGLWPLRTKDEMKEVCAAFNIPKEVCSKYVQFGNTFNLLHAAASFISHHQKSIGVAGVSDKYGKRSWARYPALWTLRNIDSLPNPDPTDIAALDEQPLAVDKIEIDQEAEKKRPEDKRQAQEWAGIKQDPNADLFVFVGRWSKQKGVDLIADVMPSLLEKKPKIQLICVGPVIDLYGRFAAEKLARLMEMYPDRVFSKPEFVSLPPYLFSGADFALIPSRDEPFGLVAVEFGRKGALGVGSRLGGLGLMPGWVRRIGS